MALNRRTPGSRKAEYSFFASLKKEHIYRHVFQDEWAFKVSIQEYIAFYNGFRPHSSNGYLTPNETEEAYFEKVKVI